MVDLRYKRLFPFFFLLLREREKLEDKKKSNISPSLRGTGYNTVDSVPVVPYNPLS